MSHYDELGISREATAEQIKKAYRAKAAQVHPDKGGSADAFAPVAQAYEVLSDPARRLLYDSTGQDKRLPIDIEVQNILMQGFQQALASDEDIEVVALVRKELQNVEKQLPSQAKKLTIRKSQLEAKRSKVTLKKKRGKPKPTGVNVVHLVIDAELKNIAAQLLNIEHQIEVTHACLEALDTYSEEWESPKVQVYTMEDMMRQYAVNIAQWK